MRLLFSLRIVEMAAPRVLVLGHSFIRRLRKYIYDTVGLEQNFNIKTPMTIEWHGVGGRTVETVLQFDTPLIKRFAPDIVIVQLGTNDLSSYRPEKVGSLLHELAEILHDHYGVSVVCICQTIRREGEGRGGNADILTQYLATVLEQLNYVYLFIGNMLVSGIPTNLF